MCMRFARKNDLQKIKKEFDATDEILKKFQKCFNVAPATDVLSVVHDGKSKKLYNFRWGLIPSWAKDDSFAIKLCNARSETIHEKPSFRDAFILRRCIVIADGYYEWYTKDGKKIPVYISLRSQKPFGFAGLWESWISPQNTKIRTCSIITTEANDLTRPIHERMPVIIPKEAESDWLDPGNKDPNFLKGLLNQYPSDLMHMYEVSRIVNSSRNDSPECIEPAEEQNIT